MNPVIIDQAGPLPITVTGQWPSSDTVIVAVSGSAYANTANTMLAVKATFKDGTVVGSLTQYANQPGMHLSFPTGFHAVDGGYGEFTLTLSASGDTVTDFNDHFTVSLLY